jgi:hypothetical protein
VAGYLISLDSQASLQTCVNSGIYSTKLSDPRGDKWQTHHEGTFADYCSMRPGDHIYFFIDRKIHGIGKLVGIEGEPKYLNFPNAGNPMVYDYSAIQPDLLSDSGPGSEKQRFICLFEPDPSFFGKGVDMDDVLMSDPGRFKMLRVFWKRSFIKFADDENQAFRNILLQRNAFGRNLVTPHMSNHATVHNTIKNKLKSGNYRLEVSPFLDCVARSDGSIGHEMAVEAGLVFQLASSDRATLNVFGSWDYLSHQVHASPLKPVDYMDKMDIFGYRYISGFAPTIEKFIIIELKAGTVGEPDLLQLMKYVDWVKDEYASGDYSMISAFLVGFDFSQDCKSALPDSVERNFIHGFRPSTPIRWNDVRLVTYTYNSSRKRLDFSIVNHSHPPSLS